MKPSFCGIPFIFCLGFSSYPSEQSGCVGTRWDDDPWCSLDSSRTDCNTSSCTQLGRVFCLCQPTDQLFANDDCKPAIASAVSFYWRRHRRRSGRERDLSLSPWAASQSDTSVRAFCRCRAVSEPLHSAPDPDQLSKVLFLIPLRISAGYEICKVRCRLDCELDPDFDPILKREKQIELRCSLSDSVTKFT